MTGVQYPAPGYNAEVRAGRESLFQASGKL